MKEIYFKELLVGFMLCSSWGIYAQQETVSPAENSQNVENTTQQTEESKD